MTTTLRRLFALLFLLSSSAYWSGQVQGASLGDDLTKQIRQITQGKRANVGVAILHGGQWLTLEDEDKYPIMSVFKLHVALTTLHQMERKGIQLSDSVTIAPEVMDRDTWSPLSERYPSGVIRLPLGEVIAYSVSHSDNNACNWLIDYVGGIEQVDAYIRGLGVSAFRLTETERTMKEDIRRCYHNWSKPSALVQLLHTVYTRSVLSSEHFAFLEQTLLSSSSGADKLRAGIPLGVPLAHKTGRGYRTPEGIRICDADAGVIYLPDGSKCYIAVVIKDSAEPDATNAQIIADIAQATWAHLTR